MIIITTALNSRHLVIILIQSVTIANMFSATQATLENHIKWKANSDQNGSQYPLDLQESPRK